MRAIVQREYGLPQQVLRTEDIHLPMVGDDDVLVRVRAAGVNPADWFITNGIPYLLRLAFGLRAPRNPVRGIDVAGTVEAVGKNVRQLRHGDEVFGWCGGAFAEYACAPATNFAPRPERLSFEAAAVVPVAAIAALQALRDQGNLQAGQRVLINGASGGVGTFAVQIARSFGAEVTGVCSARNAGMVRSIGAGHVIDYASEDFTRNGQRYDLILDNVANHSLSDLRRALTPGGTLVPNGGAGSRWFGPLGRIIRARTLSLFTRHRMRPFLSMENQEDLATLKGLIDSGAVTPVIDRMYSLDDVPEAIRYVGAGHARGKIVITV